MNAHQLVDRVNQLWRERLAKGDQSVPQVFIQADPSIEGTISDIDRVFLDDDGDIVISYSGSLTITLGARRL